MTYKGTTCAFNPENRLTSYGSILTAGYRADGMRAWKQNSSGRTYFIYDKNKPVLELDSVGNVVSINLFAHEGLIARRQGATDIYYLFDQQGNVSHRLNSSGSILSSSTFDAYGIETKTSDQGDPFGFNAKWGYYKDTETGMYLCTWRYYDPEKGRWLTRDPIGYRGGIGLYAYVGSKPAFNRDSSGLSAAVITIPLAGGAAVGGIAGAGSLIVAGGIGAGIGMGIGAGLDNLTDGGWGSWWCRVLGIDCEGVNELPGVPRVRPMDPCEGLDDLPWDIGLGDTDLENFCEGLAEMFCGGFPMDDAEMCANAVFELCMAMRGQVGGQDIADLLNGLGLF